LLPSGLSLRVEDRTLLPVGRDDLTLDLLATLGQLLGE
jgi:hypothetical protein